MSASSSKNVDKEKQVDKACQPKWLKDFLNKTFFDPCTTHPLHRNELKKYCVNCNLSICQHCVSSGTHNHHKILKIYRYSYKEVVPLDAMEKHIDCSQIQPFKCNTNWVISLKPLPHSGSAKGNEASSCKICSRKLVEPDSYHYCSISCKVEVVLRKPDDSTPPFISFESLRQRKQEESNEPPKRCNKRKGTPRRAPFF